MSVSSPSKEKVQSVDPSLSPFTQKTDTDTVSDTPSIVSANGISEIGETSYHFNQSDPSCDQRKDLELQV